MSEIIVLTPVALRAPDNPVAIALRAAGYEVRIHNSDLPPTPEQQLALLEGAAGVILGPELISAETMRRLPDLRVISRYGVGYDNIDLDGATELGIVATYVPDAMVDAVADLTMALILASARRLTHFDRELKRGEWRRVPVADITGSTLGLVGTGRIGLAVARRARAFNMNLIGADPFPASAFTEELDGVYVDLDELLARSDFVSLHAPGGAETRCLINADRLARMKPSAYLVNCSRGSLVDDEALEEALKSRAIAGYAADVFSSEPPLPGTAAARLMGMDAVTATPHVASFTPATVLKMGEAARLNLMAALRGERPQYLCNPELFEEASRSRIRAR